MSPLAVFITFCCALIVPVVGQWAELGSVWGMDPLSNPSPNLIRGTGPGLWDAFMNPDPPREYRTCIGRNAAGDEIRISFTYDDSQESWRTGFNRRNGLRFTATISSRSLSGLHRFVLTEFGRTEDSCSGSYLGEVLGSNQWWDRDTRRGVIGDTFLLTQGSGSSASKLVESLNLDDLTGRAISICPTSQSSGGRCTGPSQVCCKLGFDNSDATVAPVPGTMMSMSSGVSGPSGGIVNVMDIHRGGSSGSPGGPVGPNSPGSSNPLGGGGAPGGLNLMGGLPTGQDTEQPVNLDNEINLNSPDSGGGIGALVF